MPFVADALAPQERGLTGHPETKHAVRLVREQLSAPSSLDGEMVLLLPSSDLPQICRPLPKRKSPGQKGTVISMT